jgi:Flp pilus assembly protein TadG
MTPSPPHQLPLSTSAPIPCPRRLRDRRGVSIIEFVLIVPVLLLIAIGATEVGRALSIWQVVVNSAREGARVTALVYGGQSNEDLVRDRIDDYLTANGLDLAERTVTIVNIGGGTGTQAVVTVTYDYTFEFFGGIVALFEGSDPATITLSSTTRMRNE